MGQAPSIWNARGEINVPGDSLLSFYDPLSGKLKKNFQTGLHDITGLAYSPANGKLYATDFAWMDASQGALYELTISGDECTTLKLFDLDKPTALTFDKEGNLYLTIFGTAAEDAQQKPGKLLRVGKRALSRAG